MGFIYFWMSIESQEQEPEIKESETDQILPENNDIENGEEVPPPPLTLKEKFLGFFKFVGNFIQSQL